MSTVPVTSTTALAPLRDVDREFLTSISTTILRGLPEDPSERDQTIASLCRLVLAHKEHIAEFAADPPNPFFDALLALKTVTNIPSFLLPGPYAGVHTELLNFLAAIRFVRRDRLRRVKATENLARDAAAAASRQERHDALAFAKRLRGPTPPGSPTTPELEHTVAQAADALKSPPVTPPLSPIPGLDLSNLGRSLDTPKVHSPSPSSRDSMPSLISDSDSSEEAMDMIPTRPSSPVVSLPVRRPFAVPVFQASPASPPAPRLFGRPQLPPIRGRGLQRVLPRPRAATPFPVQPNGITVFLQQHTPVPHPPNPSYMRDRTSALESTNPRRSDNR